MISEGRIEHVTQGLYEIVALDQAQAIAGQARAVDRAELLASSGSTPQQAVARGFELGPVFAVQHRAVWLGVFGIVEGVGNSGICWAILTDAAERHPYVSARYVREVCRVWAGCFDVLCARVHDDNLAAKQLLRGAGWVIAPPEQWGVANQLFCTALYEGRHADV